MDDRRKIGLGVAIGFLVAAVIGLAVGLVVVASKDESTVTATTPPTQTAAFPTAPTATTPATTATQAPAQTTGTGTTASTPIRFSFPSPRAAARNYARKRLGIPGGRRLGVFKSPTDNFYAIVAWYYGNVPTAVWVRRQGAGGFGWVGLAGTTEISRAPGGLGIPDDISQPFSD